MKLTSKAVDYVQAHREAMLDELNEFLTIKSISSLSEHKQDVAEAASWLERQLLHAGLEKVEIIRLQNIQSCMESG